MMLLSHMCTHRSSDNPVLYIADSQLLLPQPEWNLLAQVARSDDSFAMQLQGAAAAALAVVFVWAMYVEMRAAKSQAGRRGSNTVAVLCAPADGQHPGQPMLCDCFMC